MEKLLNDEEYDDFTNSENYTIVNKIKNDHILKNDERPLNDNEHDCYFMNNSKYNVIAVTKLKVSLAKRLSNDRYWFCLNGFCNFHKKT